MSGLVFARVEDRDGGDDGFREISDLVGCERRGEADPREAIEAPQAAVGRFVFLVERGVGGEGDHANHSSVLSSIL